MDYETPGSIEPGKQITTHRLNELVQLVLAIGGDNAAVINASQIKVDPPLAELCRETRCPNYGLSPTCPPHVEGPEWLQEYLAQTKHAILLKIEVDQDLMYSDQRDEIGKLLHFIVIEAEKKALELGFTRIRGFAGGSCKNLFCKEHYQCEVLQGSGKCRNPDSARPSISGYGINLNELLELTGWVQPQGHKVQALTSSRYGLLLVGWQNGHKMG